jgi:hypothetical protein
MIAYFSKALAQLKVKRTIIKLLVMPMLVLGGSKVILWSCPAT